MDIRKLYSPLDILLAVDSLEHAQAAAALLNDLPLPPESRLTALGVGLPRSMHGRAALRGMDEVCAILQGKVAQITTRLLPGRPADELIIYADQHSTGLMVVGANDLHIRCGVLLLGTAQQVIEHARWPVLVVRAPYTGLRRVLLATDHSQHSRRALEHFLDFPLAPFITPLFHTISLT